MHTHTQILLIFIFVCVYIYICIYTHTRSFHISFVIYVLGLGQSPPEGIKTGKTTFLLIFIIQITNVWPYPPTIFHGLFQFRRLHKERLEVFLQKLRSIPINLHI